MKKYLKIAGSAVGLLALAAGVGAGINWAKPEAPSAALVSSYKKHVGVNHPGCAGCSTNGCGWCANVASSSTQQPFAIMVPAGAKLSNNFMSSNAGYIPLVDTTALVGGTEKIQIYSATPNVRISIEPPPELTAHSSGDLFGWYNLGSATSLPNSLTNNRSLSIAPLSSYSTIAGSSYIDWVWMQSKQMTVAPKRTMQQQCTSVLSGQAGVACFPQGGKHPASLMVRLAPMAAPKTIAALLSKFAMLETAKYSALITLEGPPKTFTTLSVEEAK